MILRVVLIAAAAAAGWAGGPVPGHVPFRVRPVGLAVLLLATAGTVILVTWLRLRRTGAECRWRPAAWRENPLQPGQPLQIFHLGAYVLAAGGLAAAAATWHSTPAYLLDALVPVAVGLGGISGVYLASRLLEARRSRPSG